MSGAGATRIRDAFNLETSRRLAERRHEAGRSFQEHLALEREALDLPDDDEEGPT